MASTTSTVGDQNTPSANKMTKIKPSLRNPERIEMIRMHRAFQSTIGRATGGYRFDGSKLVPADSLPQDPEPTFAEKVPQRLKPIKLRQMDTEQEWVFMKRVLYLTLIEDPLLGFTPIHFIAEDQNGDATRLYFREIPHTQTMCDLFCFGQQLAIINPYMRIGRMDGRHGICVDDDPGSIVVLGKKTDMCRYCGTPNAPHKCGKCKRSYCSRECQVSDWKELDHKRICKKQK